MSAVREVLQAARERIAKGWCQGQSAKGVGTDAESYCALGALSGPHMKMDIKLILDARELLSAAVYKKTLKWDVVNFNDQGHRTQADVLEVFDMAIEACP